MVRALFVILFLASFSEFLTSEAGAWTPQAGEVRTDLVLPEFRTESPRYCLFTFPAGNGDRQTVLVIADGDRLYIDKNSDGDLTAPDECEVSTREEWQSTRDHDFRIDAIEVGGRTHTGIQLSISPLENYDRDDLRIKELLKKEPDADCYIIRAEVQDDRFHGSGTEGRVVVLAGPGDNDGLLQFGKDIESAPTIHFCGELEIRLFADAKLRPGSETEITTSVGTCGIGPGTFASIGYEGMIPDAVRPRLSLQVEAGEIGKLETKTYELSHRC